MKITVLFICLVGSILSLNGQDFDTDREWDLIKVRSGIEVYLREVPGSNLKELKMHFELDGECLCELLSVLQDMPSYPDWNYKCVKSQYLEKIATTESYNYYLFDFPWPLDDRELITHSTLFQDSTTKIVRLNNRGLNEYKDAAPPHRTTRVIDHLNQWVITPTSHGKVKVDYFLRSAPGGNISTWMVNTAIDLGPIKTMEALKEVIESGKYRESKLDWVLH